MSDNRCCFGTKFRLRQEVCTKSDLIAHASGNTSKLQIYHIQTIYLKAETKNGQFFGEGVEVTYCMGSGPMKEDALVAAEDRVCWMLQYLADNIKRITCLTP